MDNHIIITRKEFDKLKLLFEGLNINILGIKIEEKIDETDSRGAYFMIEDLSALYETLGNKLTKMRKERNLLNRVMDKKVLDGKI